MSGTLAAAEPKARAFAALHNRDYRFYFVGWMLTMMGELNDKYFAGRTRVTCFTCHRGSQSPVSEPDLSIQYGEPYEDPNARDFPVETRVTAEQWELMRNHTVIGERILRAIPGLGSVARIVRHEHERWDGDGYPDGLAGTAIPIGSRIILACDAYHAMTSDRPYRDAMPHAEAVAELSADAGSQFDADVVEVLIGQLYGMRQGAAAAAPGAAVTPSASG